MPDKVKLWCWVHGDALHRVFPVRVKLSDTIFELQEAIQERKPSFKNIDVDSLELRKFDLSMTTVDVDSIKPESGQLLLAWQPISLFWNEQPPKDILSVILPRPADTMITPSSSMRDKLSDESRNNVEDQHPAKRRRFDGEETDAIESAADLLALHKNFWQGGKQFFVKQSILIPDPLSLVVEDDSKPLTLTVIENPDGEFRFGLSKLLVVEIYQTFWNLLRFEDEEWRKLLKSPGLDRFARIHHATIVTGQPGIGKTAFLIYVLLRRLMLGLTTIYCDVNTHADIFDSTGVRRVRLSDGYRIPELDVDVQCCALVNLGDELMTVPHTFYPKFRKGRVVVATSPDKGHWTGFAHEHPAKIACMPTWSWGPMYFGSLLFTNKDYSEQPDMDHCKRLQDTCSIYRGVPRLCFRALSPAEFTAQWALIQDALKSITSMGNFISAATGRVPFDSDTSHRLVRVEPVDGSWLNIRTELFSDRIAELVFDRIRLVTKARLSETLVEYLTDPDAHSKADILFEQAAHWAIRRGCTLTMTPLSSDSTEVDMLVPPVKNKENSRYYSLAIREKSGLQKVHPDFLGLYMTPVTKTEPSIDALYISPEYTTLLFQMTVSKHHSVGFRGLKRVVDMLPAKAKNDIRIVFIIPAQDVSGKPYPGIHSIQSIDTPQNADTTMVTKFQQYPQYVCRLDIDVAG